MDRSTKRCAFSYDGLCILAYFASVRVRAACRCDDGRNGDGHGCASRRPLSRQVLALGQGSDGDGLVLGRRRWWRRWRPTSQGWGSTKLARFSWTWLKLLELDAYTALLMCICRMRVLWRVRMYKGASHDTRLRFRDEWGSMMGWCAFTFVLEVGCSGWKRALGRRAH